MRYTCKCKNSNIGITICNIYTTAPKNSNMGIIIRNISTLPMPYIL